MELVPEAIWSCMALMRVSIERLLSSSPEPFGPFLFKALFPPPLAAIFSTTRSRLASSDCFGKPSEHVVVLFDQAEILRQLSQGFGARLVPFPQGLLETWMTAFSNALEPYPSRSLSRPPEKDLGNACLL
jgi:hypothetical protein